MARTKGALGERHYHFVRLIGDVEAYGPMTGTSAAVWAEVRRRATLEPTATWRVATCARGCGYLRVMTAATA